MLHRILGISALVAFGGLVFSPMATSQQPFAIPFSGNVEANCTQNTPTPGALTANTAGNRIDGSNGLITITCTVGGSYQITAVERTSWPSGDTGDATGTAKSATIENAANVTDNSANWSSDGPSDPGDILAGENALTASMSVDRSNVSAPGLNYFPPGNYTYEVRFTVTPFN